MPPETAQGHAEPFSCQFSIFLANRIGQLGDVLDMLAEAELQVLGLSVVDSTDWAVVRLVLSDPNKARERFRRDRIPFTESAVLLVELDAEEALAEACRVLTQAEISIHFAYPMTMRKREHPVMVLHVEDDVLATQALTRHDFTLLGHEDLADG